MSRWCGGRGVEGDENGSGGGWWRRGGETMCGMGWRGGEGGGSLVGWPSPESDRKSGSGVENVKEGGEGEV
ncbi:hypothetical protein Tco_1541757 [Tanacetum coccineum]